MKRSCYLRRFLVAAAIAVITLVGVWVLLENKSRAGDSYSSRWSTANAPTFYGTTKMILQKGSAFSLTDARMRVLARDFEDGDVSSKIRVVSNNVNTAEPGEYTVAYSVTDTHGNITQLNVPVSVVENEEGNYFERTLYALPATSYMEVTGARGNKMDRQVMGVMLRAGQSVEVRLVAGSARLSLYNKSGALGNQVAVSSAWQSMGASDLSALVADTPVGSTAVVAMRMKPELASIPYYHSGDNEATFKSYWASLGESVAVVEGQSSLFYLTAADKPAAWSNLAVGLASFDNLVEIYDQLLGYAYDSNEAWNQNVRAKYFVRGGGNCSGVAVYTEGALMLCGAATPTAKGFAMTPTMAHAVAHGYVGSGLTGGEIDRETAADILVHYAAAKSALAGQLPDVEMSGALAGIVSRLEAKGYLESYAALAKLTREMNSMGTLAAHPLEERYKIVLGETESGEDNPSEDNPGEGEQGEDNPDEDNSDENNSGENSGDEPGGDEDKPGSDQPGGGNPNPGEDQPGGGESEGGESEGGETSGDGSDNTDPGHSDSGEWEAGGNKPNDGSDSNGGNLSADNNGETNATDKPADSNANQDKDGKDTFTVVAEGSGSDKGEVASGTEEEDKPLADQSESVTLSVVATTNISDDARRIDGESDSRELAWPPESDTGATDTSVMEGIEEPNFAKQDVPETGTPDSKKVTKTGAAFPPFAVIAIIILVLVTGGVFAWVRKK